MKYNTNSPRPVSAHSILKKSPPREKEKSMEKRKRGEGGAPSPRGEKRILGASQDLEHRRCERCTVPVRKWSD